MKDLAEIPDNIKNRLDIHPVKWIDQVLELALERKPEPLPEKAEPVALPPVETSRSGRRGQALRYRRRRRQLTAAWRRRSVDLHAQREAAGASRSLLHCQWRVRTCHCVGPQPRCRNRA